MNEALSIPGHRIERLIGHGGMAEVYLAEQLSLGRMVAVKIMDPSLGDKEFTDRFLLEARMVASLSHANIITIYDFGKLPTGKLYLCMEYLSGGDLKERMEQGLPERKILRTLHELASGLQFVHSKGIIHRDIKPANILFRQDDSLVLTDFGIAKEINNDTGLTQIGMMVGSASYASPEQIQGLKVDLRTDIYSVGVLMLEMLTASNPFKADTFINTAMNHLQMETPLLDEKHVHLQPLLNMMLAKKPADRFESMSEFLEALDHFTNATGTNQTPAISASLDPTGAFPVMHGIPDSVASPSLSSSPVTPPPPKSHSSIETSIKEDLKKLSSEPMDEFEAEALQLLAETEQLLHNKKVDNIKKPPASNASGRYSASTHTSTGIDDLLDDAELRKASRLGNFDNNNPLLKRTPAPSSKRPVPRGLLDDEDV